VGLVQTEFPLDLTNSGHKHQRSCLSIKDSRPLHFSFCFHFHWASHQDILSPLFPAASIYTPRSQPPGLTTPNTIHGHISAAVWSTDPCQSGFNSTTSFPRTQWLEAYRKPPHATNAHPGSQRMARKQMIAAKPSAYQERNSLKIIWGLDGIIASNPRVH
jgi:hypothetical protein